jgi:hypothetical protein
MFVYYHLPLFPNGRFHFKFDRRSSGLNRPRTEVQADRQDRPLLGHTGQ